MNGHHQAALVPSQPHCLRLHYMPTETLMRIIEFAGIKPEDPSYSFGRWETTATPNYAEHPLKSLMVVCRRFHDIIIHTMRLMERAVFYSTLPRNPQHWKNNDHSTQQLMQYAEDLFYKLPEEGQPPEQPRAPICRALTVSIHQGLAADYVAFLINLAQRQGAVRHSTPPPTNPILPFEPKAPEVAENQLDELGLILRESWIVPTTHQPIVGAPIQANLYPIDRQNISGLATRIISHCLMVKKVQLALALNPERQKGSVAPQYVNNPLAEYRREMNRVFVALGQLQHLTDLSIFVGGMTLIPGDFAAIGGYMPQLQRLTVAGRFRCRSALRNSFNPISHCFPDLRHLSFIYTGHDHDFEHQAFHSWTPLSPFYSVPTTGLHPALRPGDLKNIKQWLWDDVTFPDRVTTAHNPERHHCLQLATWAQRVLPNLETFVVAVHDEAEVTFDIPEGQVLGNLTRKIVISKIRLSANNNQPPVNADVFDPLR